MQFMEWSFNISSFKFIRLYVMIHSKDIVVWQATYKISTKFGSGS